MKAWRFEVSIMEENFLGKENKYQRIIETTSKTLSGAIHKLFQEVPGLIEVKRILS